MLPDSWRRRRRPHDGFASGIRCGGENRSATPVPILPLMPKGSIDRLADVPIRWLVLGLLIAGIWIFVKSWTYRNDADRYVLRTEGETLRIAVGEELDLTLQTVGPGEYQSPPSVS